jgi:hypothetical protein
MTTPVNASYSTVSLGTSVPVPSFSTEALPPVPTGLRPNGSGTGEDSNKPSFFRNLFSNLGSFFTGEGRNKLVQGVASAVVGSLLKATFSFIKPFSFIKFKF